MDGLLHFNVTKLLQCLGTISSWRILALHSGTMQRQLGICPQEYELAVWCGANILAGLSISQHRRHWVFTDIPREQQTHDAIACKILAHFQQKRRERQRNPKARGVIW